MKRLILVTSTYDRPLRKEYIKRCVRSFKHAGDMLWLLVEDGPAIDGDVEDMIKACGIKYVYLNKGPTNDKGNTQKEFALRYIKDNGVEGVVYMADDDNWYHPGLFDEIRHTDKISIFPVGNLGPYWIERPMVKNGKIAGWDASATYRRFPVDFAGFAFDACLLSGFEGFTTKYNNVPGRESELLESIIGSPEEFEVLCGGCTRCYVRHNEPLNRQIIAKCVVMLKRTVHQLMLMVRDLTGIKIGPFSNKDREKDKIIGESRSTRS